MGTYECVCGFLLIFIAFLSLSSPVDSWHLYFSERSCFFGGLCMPHVARVCRSLIIIFYILLSFSSVSVPLSQVLSKEEKENGAIEPAQSVRTKVRAFALQNTNKNILLFCFPPSIRVFSFASMFCSFAQLVSLSVDKQPSDRVRADSRRGGAHADLL